MQTDYNDMSPGVLGGLGDSSFTDKISRLSSEAIPFGRGVVLASNNTVSLPNASTDVFAGIALQRQIATPNDTSQDVAYKSGEEVIVLRAGAVWVNAEQAVDPTKEVHLRTGDTYQGHEPGNFRTDNDGGSHPATMQITNARWISKTTGAGLALLEINIP